jgi:hypothetical protein
MVALIAALQFLGMFSSSAFTQVPVKIFSTRGVFDTETGEMLPQATPLPIADAFLDLDEQGSPGGIVTYVHGVWSSKTSAQEQAERMALSIDANNYQTLLVGFSRDSDTEVSPVGWGIAKIIAIGNGPLLAKFISDYKHIIVQMIKLELLAIHLVPE